MSIPGAWRPVRPMGLLPLGLGDRNGSNVLTTGCFGFSYTAKHRDLVWQNHDIGGGYCERSRIWFGKSQLRRDQSGLVVGFPYELRRNGRGYRG